jgi:L-alanine-DL-glutamate epimerase-like enolase superfamily enzyme
MKIAGWSLHFYRLPYVREVVWANAVERAGTFALLKLVADTGQAGVAEGTLKDAWSGVSPRSLAASLEDVLMPRVAGLEFLDESTISSALSGVADNRFAKGLIESACWTLRAAAARMPLWRLWGGQPRVELSWTVTRRSPGLMAQESAEMCARYGFRTLKVKGGQGVETDLLALAAIRAAVGAGVELYVDANGAYPRAQAAAYVAALADAGVTIAEDPCPLQPDAAFAALQAHSPIPILVDRGCASSEDAALYLERGARALSAKPGRVGLSQTRAIASLAAGCNAKTAVGIYAESLLGTLINLQQPGTLAAEQTFFLTMTEQVAAVELPIRDGCIELPETADYASLVDWEALERCALGN